VVGGLEFFDGRLHGEKEIKALLPIGVISEIPEVKSTLDEQRDKRNLVLGWTMAGFVVAAILVGSAYSYLRG